MNYQEIQQIVNLPECKIVMSDTLNKYDLPIDYFLTTNEILHYNQLITKHQQNQFKLIRGLRTASLGLKEIKYKDYGAPYLAGQDMQISISHKNNYVVFGYSPFKIGIDLEKISKRIKKVQSKFLTEQEINEFSDASDEIYTQLWAAKEAIYKTMEPPISFKNDIILTKSDDELIIGKIFDDKKSIDLNFLNIKDYILCYVLL